MKKGISRQVKIGIFGVLMAMFLYLGISYIKSKKLFSNDNVFYAEYSQADGIEVSSPVLIKGFKVGTVDKINFDIEKSTVIVKISVDNEYPIPNDSKAKITSTGLLGSQVVEIVLGSSKINYESGEHIKALRDKGLLDLAGSEYEKMKEQAARLIDQLSRALEGVNGLLSEHNISNISQTLANLNAVSGNINTLVSNQKGNIEGTLANLNSISTSINKEIPKLGVTLDNFNKISDSFATQAPELLNKANEAVTNLNTIIAKASSNDGTLGKLVNDPQVYNNLVEVTNSLNLLLLDIKQNPGDYINISVFGGKKK